MGELQKQLDDACHALTVAVAQREELICVLEVTLADLRRVVEEKRAELDTVRHERNLAHINLAASTAHVTQLEALVERRTARVRRLRKRARNLERNLARSADKPSRRLQLPMVTKRG